MNITSASDCTHTSTGTSTISILGTLTNASDITCDTIRIRTHSTSAINRVIKLSKTGIGINTRSFALRRDDPRGPAAIPKEAMMIPILGVAKKSIKYDPISIRCDDAGYVDDGVSVPDYDSP